MQRLTTRNFDMCEDCPQGTTCEHYCDSTAPICANRAIYDRLADYEDTGMDPGDMDTARLLAASAEGRILVMPCRVDDILDLLRKMAISAVYEAALKSGQGKEVFLAAKDGINRRFKNFNQTRFKAEEKLGKIRPSQS